MIAMSGGVDSSVAALLTKEAGYECIGATMKLFTNNNIGISQEHSCCSLDDVEDARSVASSMDMPYYVFNYSDRFEQCVMKPFVESYENGMTPNPCIDCNRYMKFEKLYSQAKELECDYVVTGHYARIEYDESLDRHILKKAVDPTKDQSYVLYSMTKAQLAHTIFPLGGMNKSETRAIAEKHGFVNAKKHDSQDICFVQNGSYAEFIENYTKKTYPEGNFIDMQGNVLGTHKGIIRYTIGQRRGLGLALKEPMYVAKIDVENNNVVLARDCELYSTTLTAGNINLIAYDKLDKPLRVNAKVRYRHTEQPATVTMIDDTHIKVVFDEPQRAITKGQAVVLYDGDIVVGGGTIETIE